ncbi:MAG TPA: choice-of-anchor B family protein, partial [Flavobacteriaceae bacterium]|nr:choice-of-anchor B family protein [Flavobacteriaceae bacterium]
NGDEYAIVAMDNGTAFVRITDPVNPVYLGRVPTHTGSSYWRDVKTYQDYAYIVSDGNNNHGMQIFDLKRLRTLTGSPTVSLSPDNRVTWGSGSGRGRAHNIIINEDTGYGYVLGVSPYNSGGPLFYRLDGNSDGTPDDPVMEDRYSTLGYCHDAQVVTYNGPDTEHNGKEIMIGSFSGTGLVHILDVSNKASIQILGSVGYSGADYTHQGWFTEDQRFFIAGDELDERDSGYDTRTLVFDMIDLDNPQLILEYEGPTAATDHNGYVRGNRFYLANYTDGVRILKIDGLYDGTPSLAEEDYFDTYPSNDATGTVGGIWNVYPFFESGNLVATGFNLSSSTTNNGLYILKDPLYDNTPPTVVCQPYTAVLDKSTGSVTIDALDIDGGSTDNIGITKRTLTGQTTFTCADVGDHTVTLTIEDDYGFKSSCTTIVTVVGEETIYQGAGLWSNGAPDIGSNAKISTTDFDTTGIGNSSFSACTCEIDSGRTLTVGAESYIEIENDITVNGSLIVKHTGNVVQNQEDAAVIKGASGVINVELTTPVLQTRDFMVMGSPMDSETRNEVFADAFLVLKHHPTDFVPDNTVPNPHGVTFADLNGNFWKSYSGSIDVGEGYIVRPQDSYTDPANEAYNMTYSQGTLNNGDYTRPVTLNMANDDTPNIYANPYPSAMSGYELIDQNSLINEIYFWEHLTPPSASIPGWNSTNFSMRDISMYNLSGGTKAPNDTSPTGVTEPNGVISTGQGFAIMGTNAGTITMNNSMRLTSGNTTLRIPNEENLDKLWLSLKSVEYDVSSSTLLGFNPEATAGIDPGYDSKRLSDQLSIFTTHIETDSQLGIQTTSAFDASMKFPVGFLTKIEAKTTYEIALDKMIGEKITNTKVYLHDHLEDIVSELTENNYIFESDATNSSERFTLFFTEETTLGPEEQLLQNIKMYPNPAKDIITILSIEQPLERIEIYDMRGRLLEQDLDEELTSTSINVARLKTGVYFVKIYIESGTVTKKLIKK